MPPHTGCAGSCNSRVTPRRLLGLKTTAQLNHLKGKLNREISKMELDLATSNRENSASLSKLDHRLQEMLNESGKAQDDFDKEHNETLETLGTQAEDIADNMDSANSFGEDAGKERQTLQSLRSSMRSTLYATSGCDHKCDGLALAVSGARAVSKAVLVDDEAATGEADAGRHRQMAMIASVADAPAQRAGNASNDMVQKELVIRKVEELEEKKAKLEQDQQDAVIQFSVAQRAFADRMDEFRRSKLSQDVGNAKAKHVLWTKAKHLRGQHRVTELYNQSQSDVLARLQKGSSSLSDKLRDLQAAMGRCGC